MNPAIENFLERPLSHRLAALFGSVIFVGFVFWTYMYSGALEEYDKLQADVEQLDVQKSNELRISRNLGKFRDEVRALDVKLKFVLQELPDKREIPDLLTSISNLARDAGLEINLFKPRPEALRDFYAEVPVEIAVTGSYHQVATFFDEVGQLSRIVNINHIAVHEPKTTEDKVTIKSDCVATTFRYLDESERIAVQNADKDKKRKRKK